MLPLLQSDLAQLALACCEGRLDAVDVVVREGSSCTVVAAAPRYPGNPHRRPRRRSRAPDTAGALVFRAGLDGTTVTGGQVLAVTGLGADLAAARGGVPRMSGIHFDGMQVRATSAGAPCRPHSSYAAAGVDIDGAPTPSPA
ncbi:MAG: phosphoribosylglycinamide synthetase C domain-containing protein [Ilumatobacteraceae bacterium]